MPERLALWAMVRAVLARRAYLLWPSAAGKDTSGECGDLVPHPWPQDSERCGYGEHARKVRDGDVLNLGRGLQDCDNQAHRGGNRHDRKGDRDRQKERLLRPV